MMAEPTQTVDETAGNNSQGSECELHVRLTQDAGPVRSQDLGGVGATSSQERNQLLELVGEPHHRTMAQGKSLAISLPVRHPLTY